MADMEMPDGLAAARYVMQQRAALIAAGDQEGRDTLAALAEACGGEWPNPAPMSHDHIRALIRSAFNAGALYECQRRDGVLDYRLALQSPKRGDGE